MKYKGINGYENYGDVNIEHGSIYAYENKSRSSVEVYMITLDDATNKFNVSSCEVDDDESWIDWNGVKETCDTDLTNKVEKAIDAIYYYGAENFGGFGETQVSIEQIILYLQSMGVIGDEL